MRAPATTGGDALADALTQEMRIARMDAAVVALGRRHALRPAPAGRPAIYLVLAGEATIETASGPGAVLRAGDAAILLYGDAHVIGNLPTAKSATLRIDPAGDQPASFEFGRPPWSARAAVLPAGTRLRRPRRRIDPRRSLAVVHAR